MWKFCGKAQFPQTFPFHKISTQRNQIKFRYFTQCVLFNTFEKFLCKRATAQREATCSELQICMERMYLCDKDDTKTNLVATIQLSLLLTLISFSIGIKLFKIFGFTSEVSYLSLQALLLFVGMIKTRH